MIMFRSSMGLVLCWALVFGFNVHVYAEQDGNKPCQKHYLPLREMMRGVSMSALMAEPHDQESVVVTAFYLDVPAKYSNQIIPKDKLKNWEYLNYSSLDDVGPFGRSGFGKSESIRQAECAKYYESLTHFFTNVFKNQKFPSWNPHSDQKIGKPGQTEQAVINSAVGMFMVNEGSIAKILPWDEPEKHENHEWVQVARLTPGGETKVTARGAWLNRVQQFRFGWWREYSAAKKCNHFQDIKSMTYRYHPVSIATKHGEVRAWKAYGNILGFEASKICATEVIDKSSCHQSGCSKWFTPEPTQYLTKTYEDALKITGTFKE